MIDSAWFYQQIEKEGRSLRAMARALGLDPSSVSRMLRGERKMTAEEQDKVAAYLGVSLLEVVARRRGESAGFAERGQEPLTMDLARDGRTTSHGNGSADEKNATVDNFYDRIRGCMKGTMTILPGVDLTEPADPEWGKIYDDV